ncbi:uncharacterized protein LOC129804927 [Phlebotomus papatasi]|nr:uncharacterized protein LOC129804927 [Phlebotomus papatasi]
MHCAEEFAPKKFPKTETSVQPDPNPQPEHILPVDDPYYAQNYGNAMYESQSGTWSGYGCVPSVRTELLPYRETEPGPSKPLPKIKVKPKKRSSGDSSGNGRKKSNPEMWAQTLRKKSREAGEEYVNRKGKTIPARTVKETCGDGCKRMCKVFTEEERNAIFQRFWSLPDEDKRFVIWKFVKRVEPKRKTEPTSKRGYTFQYFFEKNNVVHQVCQKFFLNTLNISCARVYYFFEKAQTPEGIPKRIKRGRNRGPNYTEEDLVRVRDHIGSFPYTQSPGHNSMKKKKFLDASLSVSAMFRMYKEQYPESRVNESVYRNIFNTNFNLSFLKIKKERAPAADLKIKLPSGNLQQKNPKFV